MVKKIGKIVGIVLLIFLAILIAIPLILESKIDAIVQNYADENLNAKVSFDDISLSLLSSFPKANVTIDNLNITTLAPFEDETLLTAKQIAFDMPLGELLKNAEEEPLVVNRILAEEFLLTLKTNEAGITNYDIVKSDNSEGASESSDSSFKFDIKDYRILNSAFTYIDEISNTDVYITRLNHNGEGIFSESISELKTNTEAQISLSVDSTSYLNNNNLKLEALIDLNLPENTYTFKDNKGFINQLPLEFDGFVKLLEDGQELDISFKNPESSFKDFLAVIPEAYAKNLDDVETTGDFKVNGTVKGVISDTTIPKLDINMSSDNASFKYPDLPKRVDDIDIDVSVKNTTGIADDTYIDINTLNFRIDQDVFKSEAHIKDLTENVKVDANVDGTLNLGNITKAYPIELENELSGILKGNLNTNFDMNAINTNAFERIKNNGTVTITNFIFSSEDIVNPIHIKQADLSFKPGEATLESFDAISGDSDFKATGNIQNLLGFLLSDNTLQGQFDLASNHFTVADFMVQSEEGDNSNKTTSNEESLKIPGFLECTINANAKEVVYDNLTLKNLNGQLIIKDQNANLKNMTADIFKGQIVISGNVNTKPKTPEFDMDLGMNEFDIAQSFKDLKLLKSLAPIAKVMQGKLNSSITLKGLLDQNFSPDLTSITGSALAELLTSKINGDQSEVLKQLGAQLNFIDLNKLDLKDVKTRLSFENGNVSVSPFTLTYEDIPIEISGNHSFENTMNYNAVFNVPAKYLGSDVNRLIGQINDEDVNKISVPVTANIGGTFTSPKINTDLTSSVSNLTEQLVEIQKQKLVNKGKDKVKGLLDNVLGNNKSSDSTKSDSNSTTNTVKSVLGDLLKGKKKKKDSTKNN